MRGKEMHDTSRTVLLGSFCFPVQTDQSLFTVILKNTSKTVMEQVTGGL